MSFYDIQFPFPNQQKTSLAVTLSRAQTVGLLLQTGKGQHQRKRTCTKAAAAASGEVYVRGTELGRQEVISLY